jgi:hypothetical protein
MLPPYQEDESVKDLILYALSVILLLILAHFFPDAITKR